MFYFQVLHTCKFGHFQPSILFYLHSVFSTPPPFSHYTFGNKYSTFLPSIILSPLFSTFSHSPFGNFLPSVILRAVILRSNFLPLVTLRSVIPGSVTASLGCFDFALSLENYRFACFIFEFRRDLEY